MTGSGLWRDVEGLDTDRSGSFRSGFCPRSFVYRSM